MTLLRFSFISLVVFSNVALAARTEVPITSVLPVSTMTIHTTRQPPPDPGATSRPHSPWRQNKTRESFEIHNFFRMFGWLRRNDTIRDEEIPNAIRKIQKVLHKPETGVYDDSIENVMAKPHCGTEPPYNATDAASDLPLHRRYATWGPKWDHQRLTYRFINYTADLAVEKQKAILSNAFAMWTSLIPLSITPAPASVAVPDIHIKFVSMGPMETTYAATSMLAYGSSLASGLINITFNDDYNWSDDRLMNFTAIHEIGHTLGLSHSKVQNAIMWPFYDATIRPIYSDDQAAVHALYGWRNPRWNRIDTNTATKSLITVSSIDGSPSPLDGLYQLRSNGQVLRYTAQGSWISVDNNPVTVQIAGARGNLYQRHTDGSIYKYTGTNSEWQYIGIQDFNVIDIVAAADQIYQRRRDGWVARWSGSGTSWKTIEQPLLSKQIVVSDKKVLYNLQTNGDIVMSDWPYGDGWVIIDQNETTTSIAVGGENFYKLQENGQIYWLDWANLLWRQIDDDGAIYIYAEGDFLYSWHGDGTIWRYTGTPGLWEQLDDVVNSRSVVGDSRGAVWEMLKSGEIWKLVS